jgi:hypothetical protein
MGIMKRNSLNHQNCGEFPFATISGDKVLELRTKANAHGIEWHHAAGHSSGRERISFYPKNDQERTAINRLSDLVKERKAELKEQNKALKAAKLPTSKAALWRHLEANGKTDKGFGSVDYKIGKYGKFVCSYGEPDGTLFYDSEKIAQIGQRLLK